MIEYDFGEWGIAFMFKASSVARRANILAIGPCILCIIIGSLMRYPMFGVAPKFANAVPMLYGKGADGLPNHEEYGEFKGLLSLWGSFTFVLTFLLVFRTQIAYGRYWDGISALQEVRGVWFNASSNLVAFSSNKEDKAERVTMFHHLLVRLMSILYCTALQEVAVMDNEDFSIIGKEGLSAVSLEYFEHSPDRLEVVVQWVQRLIVEAHQEGILDIAPPILSRVFQELSNGVVKVNEAMKISEYPFPFPFAQMLTVLLCTFSCTLPMVCALVIYPPLAASITYGIIFSLWSINYISAEIEMPFGDDPNDLPIRDLQDVFNRKLVTLMHPLTHQPPPFQYDPNIHDYIVPDRLKYAAQPRVSTFSVFSREHSPTNTQPCSRSTLASIHEDSNPKSRMSTASRVSRVSVAARKGNHWKVANAKAWKDRLRSVSFADDENISVNTSPMASPRLPDGEQGSNRSRSKDYAMSDDIVLNGPLCKKLSTNIPQEMLAEVEIHPALGASSKYSAHPWPDLASDTTSNPTQYAHYLSHETCPPAEFLLAAGGPKTSPEKIRQNIDDVAVFNNEANCQAHVAIEYQA